jgi:hypothetical protein
MTAQHDITWATPTVPLSSLCTAAAVNFCHPITASTLEIKGVLKLRPEVVQRLNFPKTVIIFDLVQGSRLVKRFFVVVFVRNPHPLCLQCTSWLRA